jgi:hypothetical protein
MNQFFFETRGKEKVNELMKAGMTSQAHHRSGPQKSGFLHSPLRLILILVSVLGFVGFLAR